MAKKATKTPSPKKEDDKIHPFSRPFLFLGEEKYKRGFIWPVIIGLVIVLMGNIIWPFKPDHKAPSDFFGSWALIGFVSYCIVVLAADPLFKLLSRKEDYYGEGTDDD